MSFINHLHSLNVYHGDLHTHNIVINPDTGDIRIIDFGESRLINELSDKDIKYFNKFLEPTEPFTCPQDMLAYERTNWISDYFFIG
jgi:tRNA A-37 threonylcarbamoyl transferase component Bud32